MREILLVAASLVAVGVLAELLARAWLLLFGEYYVWPPGARLHMNTDRAAVPELEPLIRIEFNAEGERGGPLPADWKDTMRVLVAGGSVAECWYLDQASTWPQVIERRLNEPENLARLGVRRVHVGNIARSLLTVEHIERIFDCVLDRYERIDAILLMVGASDLVHWLEKGTPSAIDGYELPLESIFGQHPEGPFGWSPKAFALWRIVASLRRKLLRPIVTHENAGRRIARARQAKARAKTMVREVPDPAPMLERFERNLRSLVARAKTRATRVLLVRQPWLEKEFLPEEERHLWMFGAGAGSTRLAASAAYYSLDVVWGLMRRVDERIVAVAKELGVETIDLRPVVPPNFDLWYDEMHHTAAGCERIGNAVAERLLERA
jgi:lysophospholipase L1-like esterase